MQFHWLLYYSVLEMKLFNISKDDLNQNYYYCKAEAKPSFIYGTAQR